jgi:colicin import membrane protein
MENFSDKVRAFALAMALHVACILALLVGLWWTHESRPVSMPGPVIEATLIGPTAAPKARSGAQKPTPAKPAPPKPEKQTPNELQRQNQVDQERIAALAQEKAEQEKREQEEKVRQKQVELDEKQRKLREEQQKQLADIRKQREEAERKVKQARDALAQMEDRKQKAAAQAQPEAEHEAVQATTGAGGQDNDLTARYAAAIQAAVTNNWNRPDNASAGLRCSLNIAQSPGGDVISVTIGSPCNADPVTRTSIEQAVMKAAPLPYQGYEKVFQRNIKFNFRYDG